MHRSTFLPLCLTATLLAGVTTSTCAVAAEDRPNILFLSVDDMSCDSVGAFGCKLPQTTPNIDRLASQGLRFEYAHVQVGNCMPSRNVMFSGRYPHSSRVEGFYQVKDPDYPVLADLMKQGGYFTGIRGKVGHSTPYSPYDWDIELDTTGDGAREHIKDVESYYRSTQRGIAASREAGKPFCLLVNVSDPHKPFYSEGRAGQPADDPYTPSRIFTADEVPVPGFLFDHPAVRRELALYYSTVRRADDCVGRVLQALDDSGQTESTVVVFLSDHGMPLPFAKTSLYHHSTRSPWIVRWPGVTPSGETDAQHMISSIDLLPTLLDIAGIEHPEGLQGRSFLPLLKGESQQGRDMVFKEYNENSGGIRNPMRGVQTRKFGYLFNPWVNGQRTFRTATQGTVTYRTMQQLAATDAEIAARLKLFDYGVLEEFYDYEKDPDARHNLIDDPAYQQEIAKLRQALEDWMVRTEDHALEPFRHRDDPEALAAYMQRVEQESAERRQQPRGRRQAAQQPTTRAGRRRATGLIRLTPLPAVIGARSVDVGIEHQLPEDLGAQQLHVTLKDGDGKRIERKVVSARGTGRASLTFDVPTAVPGGKVSVAVFVGEDYQHNLQHLQSEPIPVQREP